MKKYWIAVVSREHVQKSVAGNFAIACHGKADPLKKMNTGDFLIYYSPTEQFGKKDVYQKFTAIGTIGNDALSVHNLSPEQRCWKRPTDYHLAKEVPIRSLIADLSFIKNKKFWGMSFRRGLFEIPHDDFLLIGRKMGLSL